MSCTFHDFLQRFLSSNKFPQFLPTFSYVLKRRASDKASNYLIFDLPMSTWFSATNDRSFAVAVLAASGVAALLVWRHHQQRQDLETRRRRSNATLNAGNTLLNSGSEATSCGRGGPGVAPPSCCGGGGYKTNHPDAPCGGSVEEEEPALSSMRVATNRRRSGSPAETRTGAVDEDPVDWLDGNVYYEKGPPTTDDHHHVARSNPLDENGASLDESLMLLGFLSGPRPHGNGTTGMRREPAIPVGEYPQVAEDGTKADDVIKVGRVSEAEARRRYFSVFQEQCGPQETAERIGEEDQLPLVGEPRKNLPAMDF